MSVQKYTPEFQRKIMTRQFETLDQLAGYLLLDLYTLYDEYLEAENGRSSDLNYIEGIVDRTQTILVKCGVEYLEYDDYHEKVRNAKWQNA